MDLLLEKILADLDYSGKEVAVMINGSGATPLMELFIVNNRVSDVLAEKGVKVYKTLVGEYMTSIEMEGFSISLLRLDDELKELLDAKADTPAFKLKKQTAGEAFCASPAVSNYRIRRIEGGCPEKYENRRWDNDRQR